LDVKKYKRPSNNGRLDSISGIYRHLIPETKSTIKLQKLNMKKILENC